MNIRAASLVFAFVIAALPAHAQRHDDGDQDQDRRAHVQRHDDDGDDDGRAGLASAVAALTARVDKLEGLWTLAPITGGDSQTFTWTYGNGTVVTTFPDGSALKFSVGPGGRVLVTTNVEFHAFDTRTDDYLLILTRP